MSEIISVELYVENGIYGAYIGDDCGSGYKCEADTPTEVAEQVKEYIIDYFKDNLNEN